MCCADCKMLCICVCPACFSLLEIYTSTAAEEGGPMLCGFLLLDAVWRIDDCWLLTDHQSWDLNDGFMCSHISSVPAVLFILGSSSSLHLDPKLTWLAPGAPPNGKDPRPILAATQPWFQRHPSRQTFLSRTLALLLSEPFPSYQPFCEALLAVEASHVTPDAEKAPAQQAGDESASGQLNVNRAREAAKKLLAEQRGNLGMWAAYAGLESRAGQYKVRKKSKKAKSTPDHRLPNAVAA